LRCVFVVQREIGWRRGSRKMLLYSTDAGFHYAGDGKVWYGRRRADVMGGVRESDGGCRMDEVVG